MAQQVSVKSREDGIKWLTNLQLLHEDYHQAMQEAGETLQSMDQFCEGTIVDELVEVGTQIINAGEQVFKAIDSIADTITSVLNVVDQFKDGVVDAIAGVVKKLF